MPGLSMMALQQVYPAYLGNEPGQSFLRISE